MVVHPLLYHVKRGRTDVHGQTSYDACAHELNVDKLSRLGRNQAEEWDPYRVFAEIISKETLDKSVKLERLFQCIYLVSSDGEHKPQRSLRFPERINS